MFNFTAFTDWPALKKSFKHGARNALTKAGAFVRRRARSSIRKRKRQLHIAEGAQQRCSGARRR